MSEIARRDQPPPEWGSHHHRSPENSVGRFVLAGIIVLLLIAVAGGTTWWMYTREPVAGQPPPAPSTAKCPSPSLRVVAAPEIAPVVLDAAHTIGPPQGGCSPVEVVAEEPSITAGAERRPDVWIPSSSAWLRIGPAGAAYATAGAPLAFSPIVLAAPPAIAGLFAERDQTSWVGLTDGVTGGRLTTVSMPDPLRTTVGLLSVFGVNRAMARTTKDPGIAQLRALTLRSRLKNADGDPAATLRKVAAEWNTTSVVNDVGVFPVTEQQLTAYQRGGNTVRLQGAYPADGLVEADYPYAVAKATKHRELADRLRAAIGRTALTEAGFRLDRTPKALTAPASAEELLVPARTWLAYRSLTTQVLLLIDASGSMNDKVKGLGGRVTTRAALLRESGKAAAQLFSEDASVGMWQFASPTPASPPHTEVVPFGPIASTVGSKPRRQALAAAMAGYRAPPVAGTPLYQSVLDATAEMQTRVRDDAVTLVVVLTDGDDGESRHAMPHAQFLARLKAQHDPKRPVPVIAVGYGPGADMRALSDMAAVTGGAAIPATDPADLASAMAKAFVAAHAPR
jgi:Ca-activated chloride channel homolog